MGLETAWAWFINFGQFFAIVFGPILVATLPIFLAGNLLLGLYFALMSILDFD